LPPPIDAGCKSTFYTLKYSPRVPELMILLDRSATMQAPLVPGSASRASLVEAALLNIIPSFHNKVKFGLIPFPPDSTDPNYAECEWDSCCVGEVFNPVIYAYPAIIGPLQCGELPGSLCPSAGYQSASSAALAAARNSFKYPPWSDTSYVLLVTASEPNCAPAFDNRDPCVSAKSAASDLANLRVPVIVLSVGNTLGSKSCLAAISKYGMAYAPSKTSYDPSTAKELSNAVYDIVSNVARASCTLETNDIPPNNATPSVYLGKRLVPPSEQDGWSFGDPSRSTIVLSDSWCDLYLASTQITYLPAGVTCSLCAGPDACPWVVF